MRAYKTHLGLVHVRASFVKTREGNFEFEDCKKYCLKQFPQFTNSYFKVKDLFVWNSLTSLKLNFVVLFCRRVTPSRMQTKMLFSRYLMLWLCWTLINTIRTLNNRSPWRVRYSLLLEFPVFGSLCLYSLFSLVSICQSLFIFSGCSYIIISN